MPAYGRGSRSPVVPVEPVVPVVPVAPVVPATVSQDGYSDLAAPIRRSSCMWPVRVK